MNSVFQLNTHRETRHRACVPRRYPLIPVSMSVGLCVQSSVIKPNQSSPEQREDVAKTHNVTHTHTQMERIRPGEQCVRGQEKYSGREENN